MALRTFHFRTYFLYIFICITLVLLVFELYLFILISHNERMHVHDSIIQNYEDIFCGRRIKLLPSETVVKNGECPSRGIVTAFKHDPICLNMWRYANLIAATHVTGLKAYVPDCMEAALSAIFSNISLPLLAEISHCKFPNMSSSPASIVEWIREEDDKKSLIVSWNDLYTYAVIEHLDEIKQNFMFRKEFVSVADTVLTKCAQPRKPKEVIYIGVYITRTISVAMQEFDNTYPSVQFFLDAMDHYRRRFKNAVFVTIAEYPSFWSRRFRSKDVIILDARTFSGEGLVMAVLSRCNHTILGLPGCAMWGSILSGGDAIVSLSLADDYSTVLQAFPNWNYLENNTKSEVFDPKIISREW